MFNTMKKMLLVNFLSDILIALAKGIIDYTTSIPALSINFIIGSEIVLYFYILLVKYWNLIEIFDTFNNIGKWHK